jgi:uncharacterized membrane protein YadS
MTMGAAQPLRGPAEGAPGALWRGVALTGAIAGAAAAAGSLLPTVGAPVFGLLFGLLIGATAWAGPSYRPGISFSGRQLLQLSVILIGSGISLGQVVETGIGSLTVMLSTLAACLLAAWLLGRALAIPAGMTALIGVGTAICGASAIAAAAPVVRAPGRDIAYAIATIFTFNVAAVLLFPPLGRLLALSQESFGLFAGTAINDTSSVVAAAYRYGPEALAAGTVVKLARATMIVPVVVGLALLWARRGVGPHPPGAGPHLKGAGPHLEGAGPHLKGADLIRSFPWFIVWFLLAALLNSLGLLPPWLTAWTTAAGRFLIVVALTAVGLSAPLREMVQAGPRPLLLGLLLWITVAVTSLGVQYLTGRW